ncbi:MAG: cupin domain-containing protein [Pseudomonadota bacterium]
MTVAPSAEVLIDALGLEPHVEGGYYRRIYSGDDVPMLVLAEGQRAALTSIQYLLTATSPVGHFHRNRSTIVHYFQAGDPLHYRLIDAEGTLTECILGANVVAGEQLTLVVPGGVWKSSELQATAVFGYGLIAEAVTPGFEFAEMELGDAARLARDFPQHSSLFNCFCSR